MTPYRNQIEDLLKANAGRGILATRNHIGLPHITPIKFWNVDDHGLWFSLSPTGRTIKNTQEVPEVAISLTDWRSFKGLQLKGTVKVTPPPQGQTPDTELEAKGFTSHAYVEIHEIYDIIPGSGKDLRKPIWSDGKAWRKTSAPPAFQPPSTTGQGVPETLTKEIDSLNDRLQEKFVPSYVSTVDTNGVPNISPRFLLEFDRTYWFYGDGFRNKTYLNAARPSALAISIVDWEGNVGYSAHGWAELKFSGEWIAKVQDKWKEIGFKPAAVQAVLFHPEKVEQLHLAPAKPLFQGRDRESWMFPAKAEGV